MRFFIAPDIFEAYPDVVIGCVVIRDLQNSKALPEDFYSSIHFSDRDLSEDETIQRWRELYRSFGAKPKKYKCSLENLASYDDLYQISPLVDIYNAASLNSWMPFGAEDIDAMSGDLQLCFAQGDERFVPLGSQEVFSPREGEVVYKDDEKVICRRWNWRESNETKVTESSKNVIVVCEGFSKEEVESGVKVFTELFEKYGSGNISTAILDSASTDIEI